MVDSIDPSTPPSLAPGATDSDADTTPAIDPNRPPEAPAEPEEESDEEWMRRFIEENIHLAAPPVVRPPAPPPQPWDGPKSQWKVPDHLSMPHPNGGYMAMALMSRTMDDLDEVTGGKRAATYEEVDKYFGHALIAEGLVPFTYTADEAIRWWKAGGYRVLGGTAAPTDFPLYQGIQGHSSGSPALIHASFSAPVASVGDQATQTADFPIVKDAGSSAQQSAAHFELDDETMKSLKNGAAAENLVSAPAQRFMAELGAAEADNFGYLAEKYETSNKGPGTISSGKDDPGGASYGSYQLSTKKNKLQEFLLSEENLWKKEFSGLTPVTPAFDKAWKDIAKKEPTLFRNAQFAFMHRTNYLPTVAKVEKETKVDLDAFSSPVRAAVFSTTNQHGKASVPLIRAVNATNALVKADDPTYEQVLIQQIYAQRAKYVVGVAKGNKNAGQKKQLQSLVKKRYVPEEADALAELQPGK